MKWTEQEADVVLSLPGVSGRCLHSANGCEYVVLRVAPGASVAPHTLEIAVTFFVVAGAGVLVSDGTEVAVQAGELVETVAGSERAVVNRGDAELALLVIKHTG